MYFFENYSNEDIYPESKELVKIYIEWILNLQQGKCYFDQNVK